MAAALFLYFRFTVNDEELEGQKKIRKCFTCQAPKLQPILYFKNKVAILMQNVRVNIGQAIFMRLHKKQKKLF